MTRASIPACSHASQPASHPDPEVRWRCRHVFHELLHTSNLDAALEVTRTARIWGDQHKNSLPSAEAKFLERLFDDIDAFALGHIQRLGGTATIRSVGSAIHVQLRIGPEWKGTSKELKYVQFLRGLRKLDLNGSGPYIKWSRPSRPSILASFARLVALSCTPGCATERSSSASCKPHTRTLFHGGHN